MTAPRDAIVAKPSAAGSGLARPAARPAPVDLEGGKARAGLQPAAPVSARRMDHVNLSVRDLDVSAGFYAALLGIELKEQGDNGTTRWCILGARDRFYVCLSEIRGAERFKPEGIHINHVGFVVDDIDDTVRCIRALGLPLEYGDKTLDWARSRSAYVMDPNGIVIEFTNKFGGALG